MAHSHENVGGCSRSSCPLRVLLSYGGLYTTQVEHGWRDGGGEEIISCSGKLQRYKQYLHNNIYVSGSVFVKIANEFNMNIYRLAVYLRL